VCCFCCCLRKLTQKEKRPNEDIFDVESQTRRAKKLESWMVAAQNHIKPQDEIESFLSQARLGRYIKAFQSAGVKTLGDLVLAVEMDQERKLNKDIEAGNPFCLRNHVKMKPDKVYQFLTLISLSALAYLMSQHVLVFIIFRNRCVIYEPYSHYKK